MTLVQPEDGARHTVGLAPTLHAKAGRAGGRRLVAALALACTAFGFAVVALVGPAAVDRATFACVELPSIGKGYLRPFDAIIVAPPNRGIALRLMSEGSIVETGCIAAGPCAYRVDAADAASLLIR